MHQGRPYQIIEVRYLVTPQKAGNYTLTPTRMDLTVFTPQNRPRRGIFDDPFFGQRSSGRPATLTSEALALQVLPLPQEGRPADFGGLVGSFTLEATVEPQQLKAGESVTLTATVRGRGNVKRMPELKIPPLDGLKVYADQPVLKDETDGGGRFGLEDHEVGARAGAGRALPDSGSRDELFRHGGRPLPDAEDSRGDADRLAGQRRSRRARAGQAGGGDCPNPAQEGGRRAGERHPPRPRRDRRAGLRICRRCRAGRSSGCS